MVTKQFIKYSSQTILSAVDCRYNIDKLYFLHVEIFMVVPHDKKNTACASSLVHVYVEQKTTMKWIEMTNDEFMFYPMQ